SALRSWGSSWRQAVLNDLLSRWPLIQQIKTGADGTGTEAMSEQTRTLRPKHEGAEVTPSICPYCGVGCGGSVMQSAGRSTRRACRLFARQQFCNCCSETSAGLAEAFWRCAGTLRSRDRPIFLLSMTFCLAT